METGKVEVPLSSAYRLLHPRLVVLVSCVDEAGKANVITLAWSMPVSINPPIVAISIAPKRYSHQLIEKTKEFVVNIPTMDIVRETLFCGRRSGKTCDKFKETRLTPLPAKMVQPPIIKECVAHLECKLHKQITVGDHTLFIGRVLTAYADDGVFDDKFDLKKVKPIYHMGGDDFVTLVPEIVSPRL
ncbi:MAG: Flavin reductase like domain protein [Candidatus Bathyarchaeota archaeon BA2]|nr:MAG: Flavin reductase like domain protein [Candidatus Bathyarchaeota archaeon BA2]